ncbi:hypothetical protein FGO68_gene8290 [Halteria grandinella]|uniref:Uncharacterized protein n=1 Tax=Halteria grandinella TaxID=5974 RepID=A0A8J8NP68_HALGN|nr:hypothetical protein FGO68_gene8290 [Halteria grandinella]
MFGRGHSMQQEHFNHSGGMDDKHYQMMLQLSLGMLASCYMISMFNYLFFQARLENRGNNAQESSEQQMEREAAQEGKK